MPLCDVDREYHCLFRGQRELLGDRIVGQIIRGSVVRRPLA